MPKSKATKPVERSMIAARLPADVVADLKRRAIAEGTSVNEILERVVREGLAKPLRRSS
jgi:hypothetical protein